MPLRFSHRQALITGLGAIAGAAIHIGANADDSSPGGDPCAPWREWRGALGTGARALVGGAILAANAHNTQPWMFCVRPGRVDLYADEGRDLGAMDPFRREMRISLGCAVENLCLMALAGGYATRVTLEQATLSEPAPVGGVRRVASIAHARGAAAASPLYVAIPARHTNRGPYDRDRPIASEALAKLAALAADEPGVKLFLLTDPSVCSEFAAATTTATEAIIADATMIHDATHGFADQMPRSRRIATVPRSARPVSRPL
jgi:hypothetical protein